MLQGTGEMTVCDISVMTTSSVSFVPLTTALVDRNAGGDAPVPESPLKKPSSGSYQIGPFSAGEEHGVTEVSYDEETAQFWVQSSTRDIDTFNLELQEKANGLEILHQLPENGECLVGMFAEDENWYRCVAIDVTEDMICVRYIDFGNKE